MGGGTREVEEMKIESKRKVRVWADDYVERTLYTENAVHVEKMIKAERMRQLNPIMDTRAMLFSC